MRASSEAVVELSNKLSDVVLAAWDKGDISAPEVLEAVGWVRWAWEGALKDVAQERDGGS